MSQLRRACVCHTSGAPAGHALITGSSSREHYYMVEFRQRTVATVASETAVGSARSRVFPADEGARSSVTNCTVATVAAFILCLIFHMYYQKGL